MLPKASVELKETPALRRLFSSREAAFFCRFWCFGSKICAEKVLRFCVFCLRVISCLCLGTTRRGKFTRSIASLYHTDYWKNKVAFFNKGSDALYEVGAGTTAAASCGKDSSLNWSTRLRQQRKPLKNWTSYSVTNEHTRHVKTVLSRGWRKWTHQDRGGIINEKTGKQRRTPLSVRVPPSSGKASRAMEEEGSIEPIMANVSLTVCGLRVSFS